MGQPHTGPRCSIHRNEANTTTYNSNFPTQQSQKVTLLATRFVHPPSWLTPATTPTFPHQQAEKSPQNQHVLSCNPKNPTSTSAQAAGEPGCDARGRRQGLAGQRADAPSEARARTASGRAAAHGHTKQPGCDSGKVRGPARGARSSGHPDPPHARPRTPPRPRT